MIRTILHYPDPRLREKGEKVTALSPALLTLIDDMAETMYAAPGVGLAVTQIGEAVSLFVIDIPLEDEASDLKVFINPEIVFSGEPSSMKEGCLSFPGVTEEIKRSAKIRVKALDPDLKPFELEAEGLLAVAIQHE